MDDQLAIVTVSILIGFALGWPMGYARCKRQYKKWAGLLQSMSKGKKV